MKKIIVTALVSAFILTSCAAAEPTVSEVAPESSDEPVSEEVIPDYQPCLPEGGAWKLTFWDDFDGDTLDSTKWAPAPEGDRRDGVWSGALAFPDGSGNLDVRTEWRDGKAWSGAIRTFGKFVQAKGYFEMRCKFPPQTGMWHAFWLMCGNVQSEKNGSSDGIEIDICEYLANLGGVNLAVHWDGYGDAHKADNTFVENTALGDGYHVFGMLWDDSGYTFYIDGEETWHTDADGVCEKPGYIKLTTEVGDWGGVVDPETLPADWLVDYVRVYTPAE